MKGRTRMRQSAGGSGSVQALVLISVLALGGIAGVKMLDRGISARARCAGEEIRTLTVGAEPCGESAVAASVAATPPPPTVSQRGEGEGRGGGGDRGGGEPRGERRDIADDSERERAARDLQPGLYDDVPGTEEERINTSTPPPPDGDQCSSSPDKVPGLYDFSYACYAHDLCWQNGSIGGQPMTIGACNEEFRRRMRDHCDRRNTGFGSGFRENLCFDAADAYFTAVSAAGAAKAIQDCPLLVAAVGPVLAEYLCHPTPRRS